MTLLDFIVATCPKELPGVTETQVSLDGQIADLVQTVTPEQLHRSMRCAQVLLRSKDQDFAVMAGMAVIGFAYLTLRARGEAN